MIDGSSGTKGRLERNDSSMIGLDAEAQTPIVLVTVHYRFH